MATEIGEKIRAFRQFSGLSQEAFAQRLGVSFTTVNRWENGHAVPNPLAQRNIEQIWEKYGFVPPGQNCELQRVRILVVDDEPIIFRIMKRNVQKLQIEYIMEAAEDGYEAGLKVSRFQPDVVILDVFLPGIRGDLLCKKIKENPETRATYIIAISGYMDRELEQQLLKNGADVVLHKPLDFKTVNHHILQIHLKKNKSL